MNHMRNCRRCPMEIRENLELMKRARMGPDGKRLDKPKHGGRKVFFRRLWCRIQGLPLDDEAICKKKNPGGKPKKKKFDAEEEKKSDTNEENMKKTIVALSEEETETESSEGENYIKDRKLSENKSKTKNSKTKKTRSWSDGCVRLTKHDDPEWLSELHCYTRSDLIEAFCWHESDGLAGYTGRKRPSEGQVGIRCVFTKSLDDFDKPSGCLVFPEDLESIPDKVKDMLRLHFKSCSHMPIDKREIFKSLRNHGPKVDDSQYWIDSARDTGLIENPNPDGWGITFYRDPLQPSPCDELDREHASGIPSPLSKLYLIKPDDRSLCTDQVLLLMRQFKVTVFRSSDRRGGPNARGRDRATDYPGLACKHCSNKNNAGRYFPLSAKNLTDTTANSMLNHIVSCSRCPESIKASISYLSHRGVHQKTELSGSWKKTYFKKIWDRLHVDREWVDALKNDGEEGAPVLSDSVDEDSAGEDDENDDSDSENDDEGEGGNMNALIQAAAIWLTEQDTKDGNSAGKKGRNLPSKRSAPKGRSTKGKISYSDGDDSDDLSPPKRRRRSSNT